MIIPKIIHQTAPSRDRLNSRVVSNIEHIKKLNPDWDYWLWDDRSIEEYLDRFHTSRFKSLYKKINKKYGAARADVFRYLIMYHYGGVYLDIKSSLGSPLNSIIRDDDEFVLSHWDAKSFPGHGVWHQYGVAKEFQQWHIICRPKHPFIKSVLHRVYFNLENYTPISTGIGRMAVLLTTGPIPYTRAILPKLQDHPHRIMSSHVDLELIYSIADLGEISRAVLIGSDYRAQRTSLTVKYGKYSPQTLSARINRMLRISRLEEPYKRFDQQT